MPVRVVTDSTADLPPHAAEELGITVVPLTVIFGDRAYRDGVDLTSEEFFERLAQSSVLPTTSQPSVGAFQDAYEKLAQETNEIVSIHISSKLSGTCEAALRARDTIARGPRIALVDSLSASMGLGLIVIVAGRAARAGAGLDEVVNLARSLVPRVHVFALFGTLEYLRRGGRIGRAQAFLGNVLDLKPILAIRDGVAHPAARVRTRQRAVDKMLELATGRGDIAEAAVIHSTTQEEAEAFAQRVSECLPGVRLHIGRIGPVIGVHGGPGALGIAILEQEQSPPVLPPLGRVEA
jgi:DegV family protein with EDD domain